MPNTEPTQDEENNSSNHNSTGSSFMISPYNIPFPFDPYPLQIDAINRLYEFLQQLNSNNNNSNNSMDNKVVVLESPTGTGKSLMLLHSILSSQYRIMYHDENNHNNNNNNENQKQGEGQSDSNNNNNSVAVSIEEVLQKQRLEEEIERVRESRKLFIKEERRKIRSIQKISQSINANKVNTKTHDEEEGFIIDQQNEFLDEYFGSNNENNKKLYGPGNNFSSSSDDEENNIIFNIKNSDSGVTHNNNNNNNIDLLLFNIPLVKNKIYFSSRTHTQLSQLFDDFRNSVFAKNKVKENNEDANSESFYLRSVHLASRQLLCINKTLRMKSSRKSNNNNNNASVNNEMLSDLCNEAVTYEKSSEGIKRRREAQLKKQQEGFSNTINNNNNNNNLSDLEDLAANKDEESFGCPYANANRLENLISYINATHSNFSMEEIVALGKKFQACPYYLINRLLVRQSHLVFLPYNYLVSEGQRSFLFGGPSTNSLTFEEEEKEKEGEKNNKNNNESCSEGLVSFRRRLFLSPPPLLFNKNKHNRDNNGSRDRRREKERVSLLLLQLFLCQKKSPNFNNSILVIDEAHNISNYCEGSSTSFLYYSDIGAMIKVLKCYYGKYESLLLAKNKQKLRGLVDFLSKLEEYMRSIIQRISSSNDNNNNFITNFGTFLFDGKLDVIDVFPLILFLMESKLKVKVESLLASILRRQAVLLMKKLNSNNVNKNEKKKSKNVDNDDDDNNNNNNNNSKAEEELFQFFYSNNNNKETSISSISKRIAKSFQQLESFMEFYYYSDVNNSRILIQREVPNNNNNNNSNIDNNIWVMKLIQLNYGEVTLLPVIRQCKSLVLAGGTMKPLNLTVHPLLRENDNHDNKRNNSNSNNSVTVISEGHVIDNERVAVFALGNSCGGRRLEFSKSFLQLNNGSDNNNNNNIWSEVSLLILNLVRVLPPAGAVCFFPSYELLHSFIDHLSRSEHFRQIDAVKKIFYEGMETDGSGVDIFEAYKSWVVPRGSHSGVRSTTTNNNNSNNIVRRGGLLFSVMGGKLSEGINFSDDYGRAVVVIGLPYANISDMELLTRIKHDAQSRSSDSSALATADEWKCYTDMCMRTVNQAIGRCIRHSKDYAAIVLIDHRYREARVLDRVAGWLRPCVRVAGSFGEVFRGVRSFFERMES